MPGNEQKAMNRAKNHARSAIISLSVSVQTTVTHKLWINKIPQCII